MKENAVMVFSKDYCPFCKQAKMFLKREGINFKAVEMDLIPEGRLMHEHLKRIAMHSTVPVIYINQKKIGGFDDLMNFHKSGRLNQVVNQKVF